MRRQLVSLFCSLFFTKSKLYSSNLNIHSTYDWPHTDIVKEITKESTNLVSTLAILPDTRDINTFNLEAEASRQGEYVAVRQVISNKETYKEDLEFFDWFLIKTGYQGVMSNEAKKLLNEYLLNSPSFVIQKEWDLPDKSKISLLRRKSLNTYLINYDCKDSSSNLDIKKMIIEMNMSLEEIYYYSRMVDHNMAMPDSIASKNANKDMPPFEDLRKLDFNIDY